ncbi:MAG: protein-glutamate O-methyltransferase CheR [Epulopiscium sp.]|nr:protein-glutamate O-methyltransferase CheR [Candidatus Epulonipiscium sp.]
MLHITEKEFKELSEYMKCYYGIYLKPEKKSLVMGRLQNVLSQGHFDSFSSYFEYIYSDQSGEAVKTLINKLTTNHTFFMREADHFIYFKDKVLPYLSSVEASKKDLRIWSAGCSSGEEPYTLVMIMADYFGDRKGLWDTKILATDISTKVLEKAIQGVYSKENISVLPKHWQFNYFNRLNDREYIISDTIKKEVIFRRFNLNSATFPFKNKFHVIFCRNVMIYFDSETKRKLINKFYEMTEPGGYLFIGHSESISRGEVGYKYIMPAVYRKE